MTLSLGGYALTDCPLVNILLGDFLASMPMITHCTFREVKTLDVTRNVNGDFKHGSAQKHKIIKYALGISATLGWSLALLLLLSSTPRETVTQGQLSSEISYNYTRNTVWFHSEGKIRELRSIISQHDINNPQEVHKIKALIKSMLMRRTDVYTQELNSLNTPIDHIGNFYLQAFDFENFLEEVIEVSLAKDKSLDSKMIAVYEIMFVYQMEANEALKNALSKR
ncbi:hypothetical protein [Vibrio breoganii]|uniref:hypothetical protein n=1 Tax=Vibrio breoganii TaxID=553239 RepID=UPI001054B2F5|nr:hypothetical protein [Vibrio breoganii]